MREIIYSRVGNFRNFIVCAGYSRTKWEGWQVWIKHWTWIDGRSNDRGSAAAVIYQILLFYFINIYYYFYICNIILIKTERGCIWNEEIPIQIVFVSKTWNLWIQLRIVYYIVQYTINLCSTKYAINYFRSDCF